MVKTTCSGAASGLVSPGLTLSSCVAWGMWYAPPRPPTSPPQPFQSHTDTFPTGYMWPFKHIKIK